MSAVRGIVRVIDLDGAVAREQRRQRLIDELGVGRTGAHLPGVVEEFAVHGGAESSPGSDGCGMKRAMRDGVAVGRR